MTNPTLIPPRVQEKMTGTTISIKGVLEDSPMPILPNIGGDPTREALMGLHRMISVNATYVVSNLVGCRHGHLALKITAENYME